MKCPICTDVNLVISERQGILYWLSYPHVPIFNNSYGDLIVDRVASDTVMPAWMGVGYAALGLEDKVADQDAEIQAVSATVYRLKTDLKDQGES